MSFFPRSLRFLNYSLLLLFRQAIRHSRVTIAFFALLLLVSICGLPKLRTLLAMEDVVDDSLPAKQSQQELKENFEVQNSMRLLVPRPAVGWTIKNLCSIEHWLTTERISDPNLLASLSVFDLRRGESSASHMLYPPILPLPCNSERGGLSEEKLPLALAELQKSPWRNFLIGEHGEYLLFELEMAPEEHGHFGSFNPQAVQMVENSFTVMPHFWIGNADFQQYLYIGLQRVSFLNLALLLFLVCACRLLFGTWKSGGIFVVSLLLTGTILYGLMGLFGASIDILSKSLFLMTAVAALEDYFFLSSAQKNNSRPWRLPFRTMLLPAFLTSFTTILGFASLGMAPLAIIRNFGYWASVGAILEWAILFILLPAVAKEWSKLRHWTKPKVIPGLNSLEKFRAPRFLAILLLGLYAFAGLHWGQWNLNDIPEEMFPKQHVLRQGLEKLRATSAWEDELSLVFTPELSREQVEKSFIEIKKLDMIADIRSPYEFLDYFSKDTGKLRTELIHSELKNRLKNYWSDSGSSRAVLLLRHGDTQTIHRLETELANICPEPNCKLAGTSRLYADFSALVPDTLLKSFSLSLALVSLILLWLCLASGALLYLPQILASSFWGTALLFSALSAFQIHVNFLTCIFASVLVGLTGDNAIQFLLAGRKSNLSDGIRKRGDASILCNLTMAFASLIFLGSYFIPPRIFGLLLSAGFLASLVGDYWLLRALLPKEEKCIRYKS